MVFFKFHCEVDIWLSGVEILQKPTSGGFIVEQRKYVMRISKPDGAAAFLFKVYTHENVR